MAKKKKDKEEAKEIELPIELLKVHTTEFDKYLVSISSGGIVFILLFSKFLFETTDALVIPLLGLVVIPIFFGVTILSVVFSIRLSENRYISKIVSPETEIVSLESKIAQVNYYALLSFVAGFISSVVFGTVNILGYIEPELLKLAEDYAPWSSIVIGLLNAMISLLLVRWVDPKPKWLP